MNTKAIELLELIKLDQEEAVTSGIPYSVDPPDSVEPDKSGSR